MLRYFCWLEEIVVASDYSVSRLDAPRALHMQGKLSHRPGANLAQGSEVEHTHIRGTIRRGKPQPKERLEMFSNGIGNWHHQGRKTYSASGSPAATCVRTNASRMAGSASIVSRIGLGKKCGRVGMRSEPTCPLDAARREGMPPD